MSLSAETRPDVEMALMCTATLIHRLTLTTVIQCLSIIHRLTLIIVIQCLTVIQSDPDYCDTVSVIQSDPDFCDTVSDCHTQSDPDYCDTLSVIHSETLTIVIHYLSYTVRP